MYTFQKCDIDGTEYERNLLLPYHKYNQGTELRVGFISENVVLPCFQTRDPNVQNKLYQLLSIVRYQPLATR